MDTVEAMEKVTKAMQQLRNKYFVSAEQTINQLNWRESIANFIFYSDWQTGDSKSIVNWGLEKAGKNTHLNWEVQKMGSNARYYNYADNNVVICIAGCTVIPVRST